MAFGQTRNSNSLLTLRDIDTRCALALVVVLLRGVPQVALYIVREFCAVFSHAVVLLVRAVVERLGEVADKLVADSGNLLCRHVFLKFGERLVGEVRVERRCFGVRLHELHFGARSVVAVARKHLDLDRRYVVQTLIAKLYGMRAARLFEVVRCYQCVRSHVAVLGVNLHLAEVTVRVAVATSGVVDVVDVVRTGKVVSKDGGICFRHGKCRLSFRPSRMPEGACVAVVSQFNAVATLVVVGRGRSDVHLVVGGHVFKTLVLRLRNHERLGQSICFVLEHHVARTRKFARV